MGQATDMETLWLAAADERAAEFVRGESSAVC